LDEEDTSEVDVDSGFEVRGKEEGGITGEAEDEEG
jgi:hypothetical protein